ncbi:MAG: hypothetical protein COY81_02560 [Candidatus Pacebacteria bacterium CG_4_10_14_0_8_um_filter_43_12]|nr:MAG: hypothetical protein COU66_00040 [Candidatus Pacebacteria bacterium CG10_big_fil_rev_8_21_14_0_10_44_11]PIY79423.1 MAG: hypothetical protein COY81_02560 [Candidatus Pacebacteria bacterium CG_4_10_14_0_8_um_filter_43_12]
MKSLSLTQTINFLKANWIICLIVCLAAWTRTWQLDNLGILYSDAGRDLMVAYHSVQDRTLPLLGIPSSVPRFKQGPVTIWLEMMVIVIFGVNTLAQSLTFALISILAVIGLYEFAAIYLSKRQALIAAALLALSPLAIANGRVPYHTTPLPLALVLYLFSLLLLWQRKKFNLFFVSFAFAFLFQFELAMAPLILLIPFVLWHQKRKLRKTQFLQLALGLAVGLLPQIIFDLTHKFAQVGTFVVWIGYKLLQFVSFKAGGGVSFTQYGSALAHFGGRIFSTDYWQVSVLVGVLMLVGFYIAFRDLRKKELAPAMLLVELAILLLFVSYFVYGSASEAYFPPFFILLPLHLAYTITKLNKQLQQVTLIGVVGLCLFNLYSVTQQSFFVETTQPFSYGASVREIRHIINFVDAKSTGRYQLKTLGGLEAEFPSFFENYRWLALESGQTSSEIGPVFYISNANATMPNSLFFYREYASQRVLWQPF